MKFRLRTWAEIKQTLVTDLLIAIGGVHIGLYWSGVLSGGC
jgi:hypothetical protein